MAHRGLPHFYTAFVVIQQICQRIGPISRVVAVDKHTRLSICDGNRQATDPRGHHRGAASLRLHGNEPEGFVVTRHRNQVSSLIHRDQLLRRAGINKPDALADAQFTRKIVIIIRAGSASRRATADHHSQAPVRLAAEQLGGGADEHLRAFEFL